MTLLYGRPGTHRVPARRARARSASDGKQVPSL